MKEFEYGINIYITTFFSYIIIHIYVNKIQMLRNYNANKYLKNIINIIYTYILCIVNFIQGYYIDRFL